MNALQVFLQNDGQVTRDYYDRLHACGPLGEVAVALFRAVKRSTAAKRYRRGAHRGAAYEVKSWSIGEVTRLLTAHPELNFRWGWKIDPATTGYPWVLYVDIPRRMALSDISGSALNDGCAEGVEYQQVSFHSPTRGEGPDYPGDWCGDHFSQKRIIELCDRVLPPPKPVFGGMAQEAKA